MSTLANTDIPADTTVSFASIDTEVRDIIAQVQAYMTSIAPERIEREIWRAYIFSRNAHAGVLRKSGEPYITHPVGAAQELLRLRPDIVSLQSIFLHDVPEDTTITIEEIEREFGEDVAHIVGGVEKLSKVRYRGEERTIGSLRKMFIAMSEDIRVIFVKLADRIHNMRTLQYHPSPEKRERIALETLNIYAPIADRLGIFEFKETLENECFKHIYPKEYEHIIHELNEFKVEQDIFMANIRSHIFQLFESENVPVVDVSYRIKSPLSIYRKMERKDYAHVRDLYDLFAIRIITESVRDCYDILGIIHSRWSPVPRRFKDYIALPKQNHYQSLHTTVIGVFHELTGNTNNRAQPIEIQIRTKRMHEQAEIGIAAHFEYSESGHSGIARDVDWVTELKDIVQNSQDSDFLNNMKISIFNDQIFVFTPRGEIRNLTKGSTPVDFAYTIHSDIGNHISIAKVNGRVVPLDYELKNGDSVEILVDKNKKPNPLWLSFVKTLRAKDVIKNAVNREHREEILERGRFIMNTYLMRNFGKQLDRELSFFNNVDGHILDMREKEDLLVQVGNLSRKPSSIIRNIEYLHLMYIKEVSEARSKAGKKLVNKTKDSEPAPVNTDDGIIIGGEANIPYALAKCCNPELGNKIVAYVNRNGVNIHRIDCASLRKSNLERCIPAHYANRKNQNIIVHMELLLRNQIGTFRVISDILYMMKIDIEELHTERIDDVSLCVKLILKTEDEDYYIYDRLVERIRMTVPEFIEARLIDIR